MLFFSLWWLRVYNLEFLVELATVTSPKTTPLRWSSELVDDCLMSGFPHLPIMVIGWCCWWKVEFLWVVVIVSVMVLYSEAREAPSDRGRCMDGKQMHSFCAIQLQKGSLLGRNTEMHCHQ
ncbi:hypothetical protein NPIL_222691 [Nephila pilipes]|uniref:Uncharacterized protein n=1 Tax=Nephila pilipes TaxID=299642 RepID=A0A8X6PI55_NEPPI|nr:hypothetical protein NPIL_222691 [Nephila pilipes]